MNILEGIVGDRLADNMIFTPSNIADDMLDMLPDSIWNSKTKFIDPCCKSGVFLQKILNRLMNSSDLISKFPHEETRKSHILSNQIYAVGLDATAVIVAVRGLYGRLTNAPNIAYIDGYMELMKGATSEYKGALEKEFGEVTFDVVIGNPPYNRGMDLDFVNKGFDISTRFTCMITPAKWQTADDNQRVASKTIGYGEFRKKLVPHMRHVVFYPCCKDIFNIYQHDGISFYILDKHNKYEEATIENKCKDIAWFNGTQKRSILKRESLLNIGNEMIGSLGNYKKMDIESGIKTSGKYGVYIGTMPSGYDWFVTTSPRYLLAEAKVIDTERKEEIAALPQACKCILKSSNIDECKSFASFMNTRFTRFFLVPNISKLGNTITNDCFRFVPAPPSTSSGNPWDHIYTDDELYKAFNLSQEYIDVIEAVIKERI